MLSILTILIIGIPWIGAACIWLLGDRRPRVLHALATIFALLAAIATLSVIPFSTSQTVVRIAMGGILGDFTLIPDGLAIFIAGYRDGSRKRRCYFRDRLYGPRPAISAFLCSGIVLHRCHGRFSTLW